MNWIQRTQHICLQKLVQSFEIVGQSTQPSQARGCNATRCSSCGQASGYTGCRALPCSDGVNVHARINDRLPKPSQAVAATQRVAVHANKRLVAQAAGRCPAATGLMRRWQSRNGRRKRENHIAATQRVAVRKYKQRVHTLTKPTAPDPRCRAIPAQRTAGH